MKSLTKKLLSIFMVLCLTLMSFGLTIRVSAADTVTVNLSNGVFEGEGKDATITWTEPEVIIVQNKSNANDNVKESYISPPRFYAGHIVEFKAQNGLIIKSIEFKYNSKKNGGNLSFGTGISTDGSSVVGDTKTVKSNSSSIITVTVPDTEQLNNLCIKFSSQMRVETIKVTLAQGKVLPKLDVNASFASINKTVTINKNINAKSYNIALYSGNNLVKLYNTIDLKYVIPFTAQGTYNVKIQAVTNNPDYASSDYVDLGTLIIDTIETKTIAEFLALPVETGDFKTYYQIKGTINNVKSSATGEITITDGIDEIFIYKLKGSQDGVVDIATKNLEFGDEIELIGYRSEHSNKPQVSGAYLVKQTKDYTKGFTVLNTLGSLKIGYIVNGSSEYILNQSFISTIKKDKTLPAEWSGKVGGTYETNWQSFRNDGENVISPKFTSQNSINVLIDCYLNNSASGSSTLSIIGLDSKGNQVITVTSENLSNKSTSKNNSFIVSLDLEGNDIVQIEVLFNKDGGGNVAFSNIKVGTPVSYEIAKDPELPEKNNIGLRFGGLVPSNVVDNLVGLDKNDIKFGVFYAKASELNGKTFDEAYKAHDASIKNVECSPVLVDDQGVESADGTNHQFAAVINHIPTESFNDEVTAACYVCIDGVYYLMHTTTYSVSTIAQHYVDDLATNANVKEHVDMLKWLAKVTA